MLQLQILSGKQAGAQVSASSFPFSVGRSASTDLPLEEPGVWDRHFEIQFEPGIGLTLKVQPQALVTINSEPVQEAVLRNGDIIGVGSLQIRFGISSAEQKSNSLREALTWVGLAAICATEVALIFLLISKTL